MLYNKKIRQIFSILLFFILLSSNFSTISAKELDNQEISNDIVWELENNQKILDTLSAVPTDQIPQLYWNYTISCQTGLDISKKGLVAVSCNIMADSSKVDRISSYVYLQKKSGNSYQTVANGTWNQMTYSYYAILEYTKQLYQSGTYRVLAVHYVYTKDGSREEVTVNSYDEIY